MRQWAGRAAAFGLALSMAAQMANSAHAQPAKAPGPAYSLVPLTYAGLKGWGADDHAAAFEAFVRTCRIIVADEASLRPARLPAADLRAVCGRALELGAPSSAEARRFFEANFSPFTVTSETSGFLTGYFEPEVEGSRLPDARFTTPLLARPADLVALSAENRPAALDGSISAGRYSLAGARTLEAYPDRAAIETGVLGTLAQPLVYLDPVDAFMSHVQGSVRVRLDDGSSARFAYAGRNGRPYTSIGKVLARELNVPASEMTADRLYGWLRANPAEATRLMRLNQSYIFFRRADELAPDQGPLGAASVQLVPGRSLAVDRTIWSYGLPFFVRSTLPEPGGSTADFARLLVAQDTGSAIVGAARGDLFVGSGLDAGLRAGLMRQTAHVVVLLPRALDSGATRAAGGP